MMSTDNDDGFTGLEAAIVLIAFVVVAAVFGYVVLGAGFFTTQKSQEVVHTGIESASSTLQLEGDVYGISTTGKTIDMINFTLGLAAGSTGIDFEKVVITYSNATSLETLSPVNGWQSSTATPGTWAIIGIQGQTGSPSDLLEKGQQFTISACPTTGTPKDTIFTLEIKPSVGASISISRTTPSAINTVNDIY